jgi:putative redox protein
MVEIRIRYHSGLRCDAEHGPSSEKLYTDAPVDNHGRGESFSPTDLVATALGTCMLTVMGILANAEGWDIDGIDVLVKKGMSKDPPRRIIRLAVDVTVPAAVAARLDAAARSDLEERARTCPVMQSINPGIDVPLRFTWG